MYPCILFQLFDTLCITQSKVELIPSLINDERFSETFRGCATCACVSVWPLDFYLLEFCNSALDLGVKYVLLLVNHYFKSLFY